MRKTLDPALPGSDPATGTRRLAAGDWVHVSGPEPSLTGIGKIVDGEYAPRDSVLLQARVELARGSYWFSPNALARVEPQDEALLCDEALARGVLTSEQTERVRGDVASLRRGELVYVRTPGLLDRLWAYLGERDERTPAGLVGLFEEGARALAEARRRALAERHRRELDETLGAEHRWAPGSPFRRAGATKATASATSEATTSPAPSGTAPVAVPSREVLIYRMVSQLNLGALREVARHAEIELIANASARELREEIAASDIDFDTLLEVLTPNQLEVVFRSLGAESLAHVLDAREAMRHVGAAFSEPSAPEPLRTGSPEGPVLVTVLRVLDLISLLAVARFCDVIVDPTAKVSTIAAALAEADLDLYLVLAPLGSYSLPPVCQALGLSTQGEPADMRIRILMESAWREGASASPPPGATPTSETTTAPARVPLELLQPRVLALLGCEALVRVAEAGDVPSWDGPLDDDLRARIEHAALPLERVLAALHDHELRDASLALGLEGGGTADELRARILESALEEPS